MSLHSKYENSVANAIRGAVAAARYGNKLMEGGLLSKDALQFSQGSFVLISDGDKSFVGGEGTLFQEFMESKAVGNYVGEGQKVASVFDRNYVKAPLAHIRFDQTFRNLAYDARKHK